MSIFYNFAQNRKIKLQSDFKLMNMKYLTILTLIAIPIVGFSQNKFAKIDFLIGNWQGVETGLSGDGIGFRTYSYELGKNYIMEKNQSTFPKNDKNPHGEVHRDFGVISYNSNKNEIVYRSFNIEGFTNIFVLDTTLSTETKFVFITREIENNPGNWKAKVIIEKISETEFKEFFDIAMDG
jgi:hypothetical protein